MAMDLKLLGQGLFLNRSSANDNVTEIESLVRTVKERCRVRIYTLPFTRLRLPKILKVQSIL